MGEGVTSTTCHNNK